MAVAGLQFRAEFQLCGKASMRRTKMICAALIMAAGCAMQPALPAGVELDYAFYKARVEPIFLEKRAGLTRCYICHAESNNAFRLERLASGASSWNDAQSRANFATVSKLVNPGEPDHSLLLMHPLAPEAGGNVFHSGGRQFASKDDPAWKALADWINGAKL